MRILVLALFGLCARVLMAVDSCADFKTCGECISMDKCSWCSAPNVSVRCVSKETLSKKTDWCLEKYLNVPGLGYHNLTEDTPLRPANKEKPGVQLRPQKMVVKLGPGQSTNFTISFKHAKHFPLDVYFLMDYSWTMETHIKELKKQSTHIKTQLTKLTNNVYFGLGSFIEKPAYPFVGSEHSSYAFRHHLNLTSNITLLDKSLEKKDSFSNFDAPEAGLDALMQVMACQKKIGWRPNANRIIILCTDDTYHSAGDGKLVLAHKPNDMECHLNTSNYYDYDLKQDYPSVSQIRKVSKFNKFRIIFAVTKRVETPYYLLAKEIGADTALLIESEKKESNIVQIIKEAYLASIRYVTITHQLPSFVRLTLSPDCTRDKSEECKLGHDAKMEMKATLKVVSCPTNSLDLNSKLVVRTVEGGIDDQLEIDLNIINCQCECETDGSGIQNSPDCHNSGTFQCGVCSCNKDRSGEKCDCDESKVTSRADLEECRKSNVTKYCSGNGKCGCHKCKCYDGYSGTYCEFDDNACIKKENKLCSGHGVCTLGACRCDDALWTGEDCGCSMLDHNCFAPYSKEKCFGNGECLCNECKCNKRYSGVFCEECEECAAKRCTELEEYARCNYLYNTTYCDEKHNHTANIDVQMLNKSEIILARWPSAKWCETKLDEERKIVFVHMYNKVQKKLHLIIQKEALEPEKTDIWVPVGIAIGSVILIGLLTVLMWKLIVDIIDEREYTKFENQAKADGFDVSENPLYKSALTNVSNPAFSGNQFQFSEN